MSDQGQYILSTDINCIKKTRYGYFVYNKNDKYIGRAIDLYGEYSQHEIELFDQIIKPGQTVLDIGANLGAFTLFFAQKVGIKGKVHAFEPQPFIFQALCANMALNNIMIAKCHWCGLSADAGEALIPGFDYSQENNYGGLSLDLFNQGDPVEIRTLDSFNLKACDFVKIDVEGMESDVLKGGAVTIEKFKPILFIENDRKDKSDELIRLLSKWGYNLYWYNPPLYNEKNYFENYENIYGNTVTKNMLCLPEGSDFEVVEFDRVEIPG